MISIKVLIRAAAAAMFTTTAYAADMAQPYAPPPQIAYPVSAPAGAWYLRGDIGVGLDNFSLDFLQNPLNSSNFAFQHSSLGDTTIFGGGIGYEWNNWLRFDVTADYRARTHLNAFGTYTLGGGTFGDNYNADLKSLVVLANGYIDLGTWWCLTPFIGAGVGGAHNTFADLTDTGIGTSGTGIGRDTSKWSPAWALYAGVAYNVTQNFKVEFSYRYLNFGSVTDTIDCAGGCNPDSYKLNNLTSNDFMFGMRWLLAPEPVVMPPAISTRG
jgi:opacity protein-like surface antigen